MFTVFFLSVSLIIIFGYNFFVYRQNKNNKEIQQISNFNYIGKYAYTYLVLSFWTVIASNACSISHLKSLNSIRLMEIKLLSWDRQTVAALN